MTIDDCIAGARADGRHAADQGGDRADADARHHAREVGRRHQEAGRRLPGATRQTGMALCLASVTEII